MNCPSWVPITCGAARRNSVRMTGRRSGQGSLVAGTRRLKLMTSNGGTRLALLRGAELSCRAADDPAVPSRGTAAAAATKVLSPARRVGLALPVMVPPSPREPG